MKKSSTTKPKKKYFSWPSGAPKRGRVSADDLPVYQEYVAAKKRQEQRERKRARDRAAKQAKRAARGVFMASATQGTAIHEALQGWGSTSTARLVESRTYAWHAAITVSGLSGDGLKKILSRVGSLKRNPTREGDGSYTVTITPWTAFATPREAFEVGADGRNMLDRLAAAEVAKLQADGAARVEYHGAVYNRSFGGE